MVDIQDNLTNTIGLDIRDTLRADATFLNILGLTITNAKNHIFYRAPQHQYKGFTNPRLVIFPSPQPPIEKKGYTEIVIGQVTFLVSLWGDNNEFSKVPEAMDRISSIFNDKQYTFVDENDKPVNYGLYQNSGNFTIPDEDKKNTDKGDINISLNIGGNI